jgi:hypothetical protein
VRPVDAVSEVARCFSHANRCGLHKIRLSDQGLLTTFVPLCDLIPKIYLTNSEMSYGVDANPVAAFIAQS